MWLRPAYARPNSDARRTGRILRMLRLARLLRVVKLHLADVGGLDQQQEGISQDSDFWNAKGSALLLKEAPLR